MILSIETSHDITTVVLSEDESPLGTPMAQRSCRVNGMPGVAYDYPAVAVADEQLIFGGGWSYGPGAQDRAKHLYTRIA